jgi:hypothetical protein
MTSTKEYFERMYQPELKATGTYFFCHSCLVHRPLDDRSPDERYCQLCCDFLLDEAALLDPKKRGQWVPKISDKNRHHIPQDEVVIMSTINSDEIPSGHNSPAARPEKQISKRGPKFRDDIPTDFVNELASQGKGPKAIAGILKGKGIAVSYKTIQRTLSGQREIKS